MPASTEVTYEYNNLNQKTSVGISGASPTSYGYYANGWLKTVSGHGVSNLAAYTYDPAGNRTRIGFVSGTATTYTYDGDPRYRISSIAHDPVYGSTLTIGYSHDYAGNPTAIAGTSYTYDEISRLESAGAANYDYDWVGNRYPSTHTYNSADQLTVSPNNTFTYLDTGSLYQQKTSGGVVQKTFAYTPANLLDNVVHAGIGTSSMTWDADSNRVSFTSSTGGSYEFVYDITAGIPAVLKETGSAYDKNYVREPDGSLIAMFVGSYPYYYHFDALGSTRMLTDESGHITDSYTYDAWGNLLTHDPNSISQPYQYVGQLGYYTHYQDSNLPLLQLGVRFYDPGLGRFTQVDPIDRHRGMNLYSYADCNSMLNVDPTGMLSEFQCRENYNHCIADSLKTYQKCLKNNVGIGMLGRNDFLCVVGCGLLYQRTKSKKLFEACIVGCQGLVACAAFVDQNSCEIVHEAEVDSCIEAYNRCSERAED